MPQFMPLYWIKLLTWLNVIIGITWIYNQNISLPRTLRIEVARASM